MKRVVYACLIGVGLCACVPVPTVAPKPGITALDQHMKRVASGDLSAQTALAQGFSANWGGLGQDRQTSVRLLYAAADRGEAGAQMRLVNKTPIPNAPYSVAPDELMEAAYWSYQLALAGNRIYMDRLATLYARPDFPAHNMVESCKWRLLARQTCDPQRYSAEVFQEASKRAQPLFSQFSK